MAISQTKYIDISSSIIQAAIGNRDLSGLVISSGASVTSMSPKTDIQTEYESGGVITLTLDGVLRTFGATSPEYKFAQKYFSYVSPTGRSPRALNFKKILDEMTPAEALEAALGKTANFGSFTFLDTENTYSLAELKEAYIINNGLNFRFLAVHSEKFSAIATHVTNAGTLGEIQSCHFCISNDFYGAAIPMAIAASINYSNTGSAVCFMYKQFPGEIPTVTDTDNFETLTEANINFYGQTQVNGQQLSFYQKGINLDGTDTSVYMNEVWFKSQVITNFFNLMTEVERIPANYVGESMIMSSVVLPVVATALSNGVIMVGKALTDQQKAIVFQYTNDPTAADTVTNEGYWSTISIENDGGEYKAFYRIIYAGADSVRFVDGTHNIV